jgi:uncharacterized protein (TIGR00299 family) protein
MMIASLVDAGVDIKTLERKLKSSMAVKGWGFKLRTEDVFHHFPARQLDVAGGKKEIESPARMISIIRRSKLSENVKSNAVSILETLIKAEAKVHKVREKEVHFHELSSIDTIIDIAGACTALEMLGIEKVFCSAINIGNPAPAALEIIKQKKVPVYSNNPSFELATPTGIAVISHLASGFGKMPEMSIESSGVSTGTQKIKNNVLKVFVGQTVSEQNYFGHDDVVVLETNIDDMDPRIYPYVMEKLLASGALDVWLQQVIMKKGRPGVVLSVITKNSSEQKIADIIFSETTTLGIRRIPCQRHILKRKIEGERKIAKLGANRFRVKSEFEVVKRSAFLKKKPLKDLLY